MADEWVNFDDDALELRRADNDISRLEGEIYNLESRIDYLEGMIADLENEKYDLMDRLNEPCRGCGQ